MAQDASGQAGTCQDCRETAGALAFHPFAGEWEGEARLAVPWHGLSFSCRQCLSLHWRCYDVNVAHSAIYRRMAGL